MARFLAVLVAYLYHDWQSLLVLTWVMHSTFTVSQKAFAKVTLWLYTPLFILLTSFYFAVNIDELVPAWLSGVQQGCLMVRSASGWSGGEWENFCLR